MKNQLGQKGFTLMELMVAIAIGSVILLGAGEAIFQILRGVDRGVDRLSILQDVENAALWLTRDIHTAEFTDVTDGAASTDSLTLQWTDKEDGAVHVASYSFSGSTLIRNLDGTNTTITRRIDSVSFSRSGRLLNIQVKALPKGAAISLEKTYNVLMRPE